MRQLRAASKRSVFAALAHPEAVGRVDAERVRLQRVIPMISNGFKPFFIGRFEQRADGVHLVGRFSLLPWIKVFLTAWLLLATAIGMLCGLTALRGGSGSAPALAASLLVPVLGFALAAGGRWLARGDVEWLSNVIRNALGSPAPLEAQIETTVVDEQALPVTLKVMACLLALAGAGNLLISRTGMPWMALPVTHPALLRGLDAVLGLALLWLAVGVYRRRVLAWRLGLGFLILGMLNGILALWRLPFALPTALRILESILFLAVFTYWARWWYAQRVHFSPRPPAYPGV